jgi:undecaprenyl-diphosphatase
MLQKLSRQLTREHIINLAFAGLGLMAFALFIILGSIMSRSMGEGSGIHLWDQRALVAIAEWRTQNATAAAIDLTSLGSVSLLTLIFVVFFIAFMVLRDYLAVGQLCANGLGALMLSNWFKLYFDRPRPSIVPKLVEASGNSFPSGHSLGAAAFYVCFAILAGRRFTLWWEHVVIYGLAALVIGIVACTRMYLGVHYPSDVVSGMLMGTSWALLNAAFALWVGRRLKRRHPRSDF